MSTAIESTATAILLIFIIILILHGINGTTGSWLKSKFLSWTE